MVIAVDFDETCVTHEFPKVGKDIGAVPILKELVKKGHKIILYTMRSHPDKNNQDKALSEEIIPNDTLQDAIDWFKENEIPLWGINENPKQKEWTSSSKIYANIYIDDAAKSFVAIGEKGVANRTYYIGSQNPKPLKEFLCELRDQVDPNIEIGLGEIPFNGVSLTYNEFNVHAVKDDTGFVPTVSFAEGIKNTIQWIKEN